MVTPVRSRNEFGGLTLLHEAEPGGVEKPQSKEIGVFRTIWGKVSSGSAKGLT
jgi:hypothetical protein